MKEMKSLREASKRANCGRPLAEIIRAFLESMAELTLPRIAERNSMCKYYGHIIDFAKWKNGMPSCKDCGVTVKGPEDLRKCMTTAQQRLPNPGDAKFRKK